MVREVMGGGRVGEKHGEGHYGKRSDGGSFAPSVPPPQLKCPTMESWSFPELRLYCGVLFH